MLIFFCGETGEWSNVPCSETCDGSEHKDCGVNLSDVARMLNVIRSQYLNQLDGNFDLDELSDLYRDIAGEEIV